MAPKISITCGFGNFVQKVQFILCPLIMNCFDKLLRLKVPQMPPYNLHALQCGLVKGVSKIGLLS